MLRGISDIQDVVLKRGLNINWRQWTKRFIGKCNKGVDSGDWARENMDQEALNPPATDDVARCRKDSELYLVLVDDKMVDPCWELPKVVIIGAGIAGLSAAHHLTKFGIRDVTVLEAVDRPGGRIMSCNMKCSFIVDLGASFIEGASPMNTAYNLASQEDLFHSTPQVTMNNPYSGTFMTSHGQAIPSDLQSTAHHIYQAIEKEALELYGQATSCNGSLYDYTMKRIFEESSGLPDDYRGLGSRVMTGMMNETRGYWGTDLQNMAANEYGVYTPIPGGNVSLPGGMVGLMAPLIREMSPNCLVRYCKPVESVEWSPRAMPLTEERDPCEKPKDRRCRVNTCDGDVFEADYVIVTSSLGYLQANHENMFTPPLPEFKEQAINALGVGHLTHIYLLYKEPFWIWRDGVVRMAWAKDELDTKMGCRPEAGMWDWVKGIGQIYEVPTSVQLLMARVAGEEAVYAESLSNFRLGEDITAMLRAFTGDPTIPYPLAVLNSQWMTNKYQLGSKTYLKYGSSAGDLEAMASPVPEMCSDEVPCLLFAGEATEFTGFHGTVHGARQSGIREADRILKLTRMFCGRPKCAQPNSVCCAVATPA